MRSNFNAIKHYRKTYMTKNAELEDDLLFKAVGYMRVTGIEPVLELACGEGHFTKELQRLFCNVVGVDIDPQMIEANSYLQTAYCLDFVDTPNSKRYSAVFNFFGVYGDIPKIKKMLEVAEHRLVPKGEILIVAFGLGREDTTFAIDLLRIWGEYHQFTVKGLSALATDAGFDVIDCYTLASTVLKWLEFLPMVVLKPVFMLFHWFGVGGMNIKYLRGHYVVLHAKKRRFV